MNLPEVNRFYLGIEVCSVTTANAFTNKFCWEHVHEKSENKVEKDKKNLSTLHEALANNIYQSTTSISEISENKQ